MSVKQVPVHETSTRRCQYNETKLNKYSGTNLPLLFQIRPNGLQVLDLCYYTVLAAPLPSPQHLSKCKRRDNFTAGPPQSSSIIMSQVSLQVKPYKLKATTDAQITRDDFITWKLKLEKCHNFYIERTQMLRTRIRMFVEPLVFHTKHM